MRTVSENRICSGAIVTTDREQSYVPVLKSPEVGEHLPHDDREYGHLSRINSYHSGIRHFLYRFRGVSTRWLMQYLGWQKSTGSFGPMLTDDFDLSWLLQGRYPITRSLMSQENKVL